MKQAHFDENSPVRTEGCVVPVRRRPIIPLCAAAMLTLFTATFLDVPSAQAATQTLSVPATSPAEYDAGTAHIGLDYDYAYRKATKENTDVYVARDRNVLRVTFVAHQQEPLIASQESNGPAVESDDYVGVFLWPQGTQGFQYFFAANAKGSTYQTSSENTSYTPQWTAKGDATNNGYRIVMNIPLNAIRSNGSNTWRAQFVRFTASTRALAVWSYSSTAGTIADPTFAGTLVGMKPLAASASKPAARAQIYSLAEMTNAENGGSTSRLGMDLSLPLTSTVSLVTTSHPDYSNVETDQQTISPNAFAYQYQEVRPFFSQVAQPFNAALNTDNTPAFLYTPAIPSFRDGFALEGTVGAARFSAFDASGAERSDTGVAVDLQHKDQVNQYELNVQRVSVYDRAQALTDDLTTVTAGLQHLHTFVYANEGFERGSTVTSPNAANYSEIGLGFASATSSAALSYQSIGPQFNPIDSYTAQSDIAGYELWLQKQFNFAPSDRVQDVQESIYAAKYNNHVGRSAQVDFDEQLNVDFKSLFSVHLFSNGLGVRTASDEMLPFNNWGFLVGHGLQTSNSTSLQYSRGAYYHGRLNALNALGTFEVGHDLQLHLEVDRNAYASNYAGEQNAIQSLERASIEFQISHGSSLDLGVRYINGRQIPNSYEIPTFDRANATNITAAYHLLAFHNEFYFVYGDPNSLATKPAVIFKWIRYIGAAKGT